MVKKAIIIFLVLVLFYGIFLSGSNLLSESYDRYESTIERLTKDHPFAFPVPKPPKDALKRSAMRGDSLNCVLEGGYFGGVCNSFFVKDTLAFINDGRYLKILNITDSSNPICIGEVKVISLIWDIFVAGSLAYVSADEYGLRIIDISDPFLPEEIGYYNPTGGMGGICAVDTLTYIATSNSGFQIINVSDPQNPVKVGDIKDIPLNSESKIAVKDSFAYVAASYGGVKIIDISDPSSPDSVASHQMGGIASAKAICLIDTFAYIAEGDSGLCILNIADPTSPEFAGSYATGSFTLDVSVNDTIACVVDVNNGLTILDISNPTSISEIETYAENLLSIYTRVKLLENIVYLSDYFYGFRAIDISSGASEIGNYYTWGTSHGIAIKDTLVFIASSPGKLRIMNVSNSQIPLEIGFCNTRFAAYDVFVVDSFAYIADSDSGLCIINVADPSSPFRTGSCNTRGISYGVFIKDTLAYIADGDSGLSIVDVSNPALPIEIGYCYTEDEAMNVFAQGNLAYVADGDSGLRVINVSDPTNPFEIGNFEAVSYINGVYVQDSFAYIADFGSMHFRILNISNPVFPTEVGNYGGIIACDIHVLDTIAYVASYSDGLQILNVSNPISPQLIGYYETEDRAWDVSPANNLIYITDQYDGFYIIRCTSLSGIEEKLESSEEKITGYIVLPSNIALNSLNFKYKGNASGTVIVRDITGRIVKEYTDVRPETMLSFGDKEISSGIYFIGVKGNEKSEKVVLVK